MGIFSTSLGGGGGSGNVTVIVNTGPSSGNATLVEVAAISAGLDARITAEHLKNNSQDSIIGILQSISGGTSQLQNYTLLTTTGAISAGLDSRIMTEKNRNDYQDLIITILQSVSGAQGQLPNYTLLTTTSVISAGIDSRIITLTSLTANQATQIASISGQLPLFTFLTTTSNISAGLDSRISVTESSILTLAGNAISQATQISNISASLSNYTLSSSVVAMSAGLDSRITIEKNRNDSQDVILANIPQSITNSISGYTPLTTLVGISGTLYQSIQDEATIRSNADTILTSQIIQLSGNSFSQATQIIALSGSITSINALISSGIGPNYGPQIAELSGNSNSQATQIANLSGSVLSLSAQISSSAPNYSTQIGALSGNSISQATQIFELSGNSISQSTQISNLSGSDFNQAVQIAQLSGAAQSQASQITALSGDSVSQATLISQLSGDSFSQTTLISQLSGDSVSQATLISQLSGNSISKSIQIAAISGTVLNAVLLTTNQVISGNKSFFNFISAPKGVSTSEGFGLNALSQNTSAGGSNTAIGRNSMANNTVGLNNTAIGAFSLNANISGNVNTAIGLRAFTSSIGATNNVGIGSDAGRFTLFGGSNVAIGVQAGQNNEGSNNVFIGTSAGTSITGGSGNVFIGYNAGFATQGSNQLIIANSTVGISGALLGGDFSTGDLRTRNNLIWHEGNLGAAAISGQSQNQAVQIAQLSGNSISQASQIASISGNVGVNYSAQISALSGNSISQATQIDAISASIITLSGQITGGGGVNYSTQISALSGNSISQATQISSLSASVITINANLSGYSKWSELDYVSIVDFGAVDSLVTDNTAPISAAFATGRNVLIPQGTYISDPITISTSGQYILGSGTLRLKNSSTNNFITVNADNVTMYDVTIDGNGSNQGATTFSRAVIRTALRNGLKLHNVKIKNSKDGGVYAYHASDISITECTVDSMESVAIFLQGECHRSIVTDNKVLNCQTDGIKIHGYDGISLGTTSQLGNISNNIIDYSSVTTFTSTNVLAVELWQGAHRSIVSGNITKGPNPAIKRVWGVSLDTSNYCVVSKNTTTGGVLYGIEGANSQYLTYTDNVVEDASTGFSVSNTLLGQVIARGNTFRRCSNYGLQVYNSPCQVLINQNTFSDCIDRSIYLNGGGSGSSIAGNIVVSESISAGVYTAIYCLGSDGATIEGNNMTWISGGPGCWNVVIDSPRANVFGNIFTAGAPINQSGLYGFAAAVDCTYIGNTFKYYNYNGIDVASGARAQIIGNRSLHGNAYNPSGTDQIGLNYGAYGAHTNPWDVTITAIGSQVDNVSTLVTQLSGNSLSQATQITALSGSFVGYTPITTFTSISGSLQTQINSKISTINSLSGSNINIQGTGSVYITSVGNTITISGGSSPGGAVSWGSIGGTLSAQTDLQIALDAKANKAVVTSVSANTTIGSGNQRVIQIATPIITTMNATPVLGDAVNIRNYTTSSTNTISGNGKNIEGSPTFIIYYGEAFSFEYDGTQWVAY